MVKKNYESYIIIDGNFEDEKVEEIIGKYEKHLNKNGAREVKTDRIGRKRLAYPIKKKLNGFYVCFEFMCEPKVINKIERSYKLDENILRFLTFYMSPKTLKEKEEYLKKRAMLEEKLKEEEKKESATEQIEIASIDDDILEDEDSEQQEFEDINKL